MQHTHLLNNIGVSGYIELHKLVPRHCSIDDELLGR